MSSIASASSFLSRVFSLSRSSSRRASDTRMLPAQLLDWQGGLHLLQKADYLLFRKAPLYVRLLRKRPLLGFG